MKKINEATGLAEGAFGIATLDDGKRHFPAIVRPGGEAIDASQLYRESLAIYEDWPRAFDRLVDLNAREALGGRRFGDYRACPPTPRPQVLGSGSNYRQHVAEMYTHNKMNQHNRAPGESDADFFERNLKLVDERRLKGIPFFWTGLHSSLVGATDDIVLPPVGEHHDWEAELCCVLAGGAGRFMTPDETGACIAGYTVTNDYGTVDQFRRTDVNWGCDWISKHQPTFKAVGPFVVPKPFIDTLDGMQITFRLNGETYQDWPVNDMIFSPERVLSYASERIRLLAGDLLLMGSPPGNGAKHGRFMRDGDVAETAVTYLGRQRARVRAEDICGRTPRFGPFPT